MTEYVVRIKPGVYYIDRGYSSLTNSETYDLTDDINKATKYTRQYPKAYNHSKRVYGEVYEIGSDIDEILKDIEEIKSKLKSLKENKKLLKTTNSEHIKISYDN